MEVNLVNNLTKVQINKISSKDKSNLKGAKLQIENENGNIIKEWVTDDKPLIIEGLEYGKYYILEKEAPEGYELLKEKVMFEIDGTKDVVEVTIENKVEVVVPNTLSAKSTGLIAIGMVFIAMGIGTVVYVKNKK